MPSKLVTVGAPLALVLGALFQQYIYPILTVTFGVGRTVQPISDFPAYSCRKITHALLEGCEDLRLDEQDRKIYAACAESEGRTAWQPT